MTESKLIDWLNYHSGVHRGFETWFFGDDHEATRLDLWSRTFGVYTLDELRDASDTLAASPDVDRSSWNSQLPELLKILNWNRREEKRLETDARADRCRHCRNSGLVTGRALVRQSLTTRAGNKLRIGDTFTLRCLCEIGGSHNPKIPQWDRNDGRYDVVEAKRPTTDQLREQSRRTIAGLRTRGEHQRANQAERFLRTKDHAELTGGM